MEWCVFFLQFYIFNKLFFKLDGVQLQFKSDLEYLVYMFYIMKVYSFKLSRYNFEVRFNFQICVFESYYLFYYYISVYVGDVLGFNKFLIFLKGDGSRICV